MILEKLTRDLIEIWCHSSLPTLEHRYVQANMKRSIVKAETLPSKYQIQKEKEEEWIKRMSNLFNNMFNCCNCGVLRISNIEDEGNYNETHQELCNKRNGYAFNESMERSWRFDLSYGTTTAMITSKTKDLKNIQMKKLKLTAQGKRDLELNKILTHSQCLERLVALTSRASKHEIGQKKGILVF
ncbi:unnamed protein product [Lepeophtheirus salmonis]|uniref:(salmon louse) hypothetical protein n=1 Tax=Lepeophtheirus salmonis TaxID=72036 RepID=A0A7R8D8P2_LEPSM|nr:unnamed protein product [Lepeophtheirus salmonis]CAF3036817.1 unnamed protein product [Lepeophtheirus salmonis]